MRPAVCGFLFDESKEQVVLIHKQRPAWQKGRLNGVGGKVEPGETPLQAMVREFEEETGVRIEEWEEFGTLSDKAHGFYVVFFRAVRPLDIVESVKSVTDEQVVLVQTSTMFEQHTIRNLRWVVPAAMDGEIDSITVLEKPVS